MENEPMPSAVPDPGPFFHGTKADLRPGDLLEPGYRSNFGEHASRPLAERVTCRGRSVRGVSDVPQVRRLSLADLSLLRQIDRSEHQHVQYFVADGRLVSRPFDFRVPAWDPVGNGAHSVAAKIEFAEPIVRRGADFLGVFVADEPAGLAIVESALARGTAWLAWLHVDRRHRRRGVASLLWGTAVERARGNGASAIYVSATPSDSAVGFYLSRGCRLATRSEINDHLYELEPDDVHLICDL